MRSLAALALESGLLDIRTHSFDLQQVQAPVPGARKSPRRRIHVLAGQIDTAETLAARAVGLKPVRALVATVEGGRILHLRRLHAR
jgi:hypothetical protein